MKKEKQRRAALFLVICMVLSVFSGIPVQAAEGGEGEQNLKIAWADCEWDDNEEKNIYDYEEWMESYGSWPGNYLLYIADADEKPVESISITPEDGVEVKETEATGYFDVTFMKEGDYIISAGSNSVDWRVDWPKFAFYNDAAGTDYKIDAEYTTEEGASFYLVARADEDEDNQSQDDTQCTITVDSSIKDYITIGNEEWEENEDGKSWKVVMAAIEEPKEVIIASGIEGEFDINLSWPVDWKPYYDTHSIHCYEKLTGLVAAWADIDQENEQYDHDPDFWKSCDGYWMTDYGQIYLEYWDGEGAKTPVEEVSVQYNDDEPETVQAIKSGFFVYAFDKLGKYTIRGNGSKVTIITGRPDIAFYWDADTTNRAQEVIYQRGTETTFYVAPYTEEGREVSYNVSPQEYVTVTVDGKEVGDEPIVNKTAQITISDKAKGDFELNVEGTVEIFDEGESDEPIDSWGVGDNIWINEARTGLMIKDWIIWSQEDKERAEEEGVEFPEDFDFPDVCPGSGSTKSLDWATVYDECTIYIGYMEEEDADPQTISLDKLSIWKGTQRVDQGEDAIARCYPNDDNPELTTFVFDETGEYTITYTDGDISSSVWIQVNNRNINYYDDEEETELITGVVEFERGTQKTVYLVPADKEAEITYRFNSEGVDGNIDLTIAGNDLTFDGAEATITTSGVVEVVINEGAKGYFGLGVEAYIDEEWYGGIWLDIADTYIPVFAEDGKEETGFSGEFVSKGAYYDEYPWYCDDTYFVHGDTIQEVIDGLLEAAAAGTPVRGTNEDEEGNLLAERNFEVTNTGYISISPATTNDESGNVNKPQTITVPAGVDGIRIESYGEDLIPQLHVNANNTVNIRLSGDFQQNSKTEEYSSDVYLRIADQADVELDVVHIYDTADEGYNFVELKTFIGAEIISADTVEVGGVTVNVRPLVAISTENKVTNDVGSDFGQGDDSIAIDSDESTEGLQSIRDQIKDSLPKDGNGEIEEAEIEVSLDVDILGNEEQALSGAGTDTKKKTGIGSILDKLKKALKNAVEQFVEAVKEIEFFDITLQYQVVGDNGETEGEPTALEEIDEEIAISMELPDKYQPEGKEANAYGKPYEPVVYRYHEKNGEQLTERIKSTYNENTKKLTLYTNKFSVYAVALEAAVPTGIEITKQPTTTTYEVGKLFSSAGMEVNLVFSNGDTEPVSNFKVDTTTPLKATDTKVTVSYTDQLGVIYEAEVAIKVTDSGAGTGSGTVTAPGNVTDPGTGNTQPPAAETPADTTKAGDTAVVDGNTYTVTDVTEGSKSVEYTSGDKNASKATIPSAVTINGTAYTVTAIADNAFSGSKKLTTVTIPATVTKIGKNAFKGCIKLKNITIPASVAEIGANAFSGCKKLTKVTFKGTKLTKIGQGAFQKCESLKSVTIPKSVTEIGKDAFNGCKKLSKVTFKGTAVKKIGKNAFKNIAKKAVIKVPKKKGAAYQKLLKKSGYKGTVK